MSRTSAAVALLAPPTAIPRLIVPARHPDWSRLETALVRALGVIGDCARIAWWDGSAVGLHLNGLLGLFEADAPRRGRDGA